MTTNMDDKELIARTRKEASLGNTTYSPWPQKLLNQLADRLEALTNPKPEGVKGMSIDPGWYRKALELEDGCEVGAGFETIPSTQPPTPASGEQMEELDAVDLDLIRRGDMLGPKLGAKVIDALDAAQKAIAEREAEIDRLRHDLERSMKAHSEAETHIERLEKAIRLLLDCPDIADNDHKDEETHAAERFARAALHSEQETSDED